MNAGLGVVTIAVCPGVTHVLVFGAVSVHAGTADAVAAMTTAVTTAISSARVMASSGGPRETPYVPAYKPLPVISGRSRVVQIPGLAATTAGIALTMRVAVASTPA